MEINRVCEYHHQCGEILMKDFIFYKIYIKILISKYTFNNTQRLVAEHFFTKTLDTYLENTVSCYMWHVFQYKGQLIYAF